MGCHRNSKAVQSYTHHYHTNKYYDKDERLQYLYLFSSTQGRVIL